MLLKVFPALRSEADVLKLPSSLEGITHVCQECPSGSFQVSGHRCHAIFAQPAATKTRPGVLGAIAVQLANTKMKRANMAASNALLVPPRYCWDQTPFRTVAARLGPSTSPAVRLWSAFHAVMDWTAPFRRAFRLCRQARPGRGKLEPRKIQESFPSDVKSFETW